MKFVFWSCILAYLMWDIKQTPVRFIKNRKYIIYMIIISSIHVIIYFYLGFVLGFSKSPYSHEIFVLIKNIITKIVPIIGVEVTRGVIATRNKKNKKTLAFLTIILILAEIDYNTLINFTNKEELFKYICSTILPTIVCNILYTYLTLKGSYTLVLIYRIYKETIALILPIIPNIDWFISGTVGILSPTIVYVMFKYIFEKPKKGTHYEKVSYVITFILLIALVCFMVGIFKYEPIAIASNSMTPTFSRGDMLIFKKVSDDELKKIPKNTIIIYSIGKQNVAHRIIDRVEKNGTVAYQTKGDSNNVSDMNLVQTEQIKGVYLFHLKYIGLPSVWLYEYFNNEEGR